MKLIFSLLLVFLCLKFEYIQGDDAAELTKFLKDYFEWRMTDRPESSSSRGYQRYNDVVESFVESAYDVRKEKADEMLAKLVDIDRNNLSKDEKLNYDIVENMLQTFINGYEWRYYNTINPMSFMAGPQRRPASFWKYLPFYTVGDYNNYIARLKAKKNQLDEYITLFRLAITKGTAYHRVSVNEVLNQIDRICPDADTNITACDYYEPFLDRLLKTSIPQDVRNSITSQGKTAARELVAKFREVRTFLEDEYIPATRPNYGVVNLENGKKYYQACLKWYLAVDLTPEQVHNIGLEEVGRIHGEMKKIMSKNNFNGSVAEYFTMIKQNSSMFFNTSDEMIAEYGHIINDRIASKLSTLFSDLPDIPIVVKPMLSDGAEGMYSGGSADGSNPAVFWANTLRPKEYPKILMMPITMHEALPGHHLQFSYNTLTSTPDFRSKMEGSSKFRVPYAFPSYTAFSEGWALYAESLGEELGLYPTDNDLMGRYSSEIFRACRLVVDTGIHYYNWTKEEAVDYIATYTTKARLDILPEVDRYVTIPGQACAYKIGEMKFKELRKRAAKRLGDSFNVREFHTSIMKAGLVPLNLLERNVNEWIEKQIESNSNGQSSTAEPNNPTVMAKPEPTCSSPINIPSFIIHLFVLFSIIINKQ